MKMSNKEKNLLLYLLGFGLAALAYFLVMQPHNEKTDTLKISNGALETTLTRLEELDKQKPEYQKQMEQFVEDNEAIQNKFNPTMKFEDYLLFIKEFESKYDVFMTRGVVAPGVVQAIAYPAVEGVDSAIIQPTNIEQTFLDANGNELVYSNPAGLFLINRVLQIDFDATYTDVMKYVDFVLDNEDIMEFESISLSYDSETGNLSGSATINTFSLAGNGKDYEAPQISGVQSKVNNLFGTYTAE